MTNKLFSLIRKIAKRNGSAAHYPLVTFLDGGVRYMTCENRLFPEIDPIWLFSDVSDEEAKLLLSTFVDGKTFCTYDIMRHLSRLLATKGLLFSRKMDKILERTDWESYAAPQLLLSYLAVKPDGDKWILRLLDVVPNDARDGLFTACWYRNDRSVNQKLRKKFKEWSKDPSWGGGDGEGAWFARFVSKCSNERALGSWCSCHLQTLVHGDSCRNK